MASLPHAHQAYVDARKLRDYCLDKAHPRGKHKAAVFEGALGITWADAEGLRAALLEAVREAPARFLREDSYGKLYVVDFRMMGPRGPATVRSIWIIRRDEDAPRLVTCFVR